MIRALIVDDEPLAREGLRILLAEEPDVTIVAEAGDGDAAVDAIRRQRPDVVLLDIRMPGWDGFEVLERTASEHLPLVVFVTAHDEHALRAFEVHALDYLLKPVAADRLREAIRRVRAALACEVDPGADGARARLAAALDARAGASGAAAPSPLSRFVVRDRGRFYLVRADSVEWIRSADNYVELHTPSGVHLVRGTIADLASRLDRTRFARIHRSTIVQLDRIREIVPDAHGDFDVVLQDGTTLRMSRSFQAAIFASNPRRRRE